MTETNTTSVEGDRLEQRDTVIHVLKTWPGPFAAVRSRKKTLEIRRADRDYREGDALWLEEYDPDTDSKSGEVEVRLITHVLQGGQFGIEPGFCAISMTDCPDRQIAALPCKGGEDATVTTEIKRVWEAGADWGRFGHASKSGRYDDVVPKAANVILSLAAPTTEPDTGRGLREVLEPFAEAGRMAEISGRPPGEHVDANAFIRARQALAALSDTPRGRLEKDLGAARDQSPTADAACDPSGSALITEQVKP